MVPGSPLLVVPSICKAGGPPTLALFKSLHAAQQVGILSGEGCVCEGELGRRRKTRVAESEFYVDTQLGHSPPPHELTIKMARLLLHSFGNRFLVLMVKEHKFYGRSLGKTNRGGLSKTSSPVT